MDFTAKIGNDKPNLKGINTSFMTKPFTCLLAGLQYYSFRVAPTFANSILERPRFDG